MADVPTIDIVAGIPTGGTGTVQTLSTTNTVIGAVNETAPVTDTASSGLNGRLQRIAQRLTSLIALNPALGQAAMAASTPVVIASDQSAISVSPTHGGATISTTITRETNTTTYAANDAWADDDTAPTAGGYTFTGAGRVSGGSGIILDAVISTSVAVATPLQGEILIFDTAVTAVNDNVAVVLSDAEVLTYVGKIPFALESMGANNNAIHVPGLNLAYTCVGSANLRFLVRVKNAYVPTSAEVLGIRIKVMYTS